MTDLYEEIVRKCSYEIGKAREAVSRLPADASDKDKADAVRDAFISNGGGFGWGVVGRDQVEIDARGAWLYRLINGTSGDTKVLRHYTFEQILEGMVVCMDVRNGQMKFMIRGDRMSEWISVKDRLPPRNGKYLVVTEGLGFFRGCADIKILYFYNGCFKLDDKDVYSVNITHWMPLPTLPELPPQLPKENEE